METRTKEFAWVAKLSGDNKLVKWAGKSDGTLEQIVLKLAVLGSGAKAGERNIVEITTFDSEQGKIKSCVCSLGIGKTENQQLCDISLYPPVHFTLVEGSGPVHITANHMLLDEDDFSDEEDMSDYEEEMEDVRQKLQGKRKVDAKGDGPKKSKAVAEDDDEDDLDDDLEDEDDSLDVDGFLDMEAASDEEISEEEEEVEAAPKKRKLANGQAKAEKKSGAPVKKNASPEKAKQKKQEQKAPKTPKNEAAPKTPKSEKKAAVKPKFNSVEDVKAAIKKFPGGKPRKQDKFTNWLEHQFKVDQDSWKNDLWMWHKKEQGL